ncbi:MAG: YicC/YloC family endoribonuclease [Myxococcota bacterium]
MRLLANMAVSRSIERIAAVDLIRSGWPRIHGVREDANAMSAGLPVAASGGYVLKSMTGFGAARREQEGLRVSAEVRAVNGRYLKISVNVPSLVRSRDTEIESLIRKRLARGSVTVSVQVKLTDPERLVAIDEDLAAAYQKSFRRLGLNEDSIPLLPGVVGGCESEELSDQEAAAVIGTVDDAVAELVAMREREGKALRDLLTCMCDRIVDLCASVRARAPVVAQEYKQKLHDRLARLLAGGEAGVDPQLVAREVAVFADRCDVTEEVDRIGGHLVQIREQFDNSTAAGRKLEFLGQELLRESNTMGSKSGDTEISRLVIEMKSLVEQFKEQAANVE